MQPEAAPDLDPLRLMGAWYVLVTNDGFWRTRTHPRIDRAPLERVPDGVPRARHSLRFRQPNLLGRVQRKHLLGTDHAGPPGHFVWRGQGMRRLSARCWCVPIVDADYRWAIAWCARSSLGAPAGLGVYTRDPTIPQALLDDILARVRAHPFLGSPEREGRPRRCDRLFATVQDWIPPRPYQLDS